MKDIHQLVVAKTKTSVWAATNCRTTKSVKQRLSVIKELQNNHMNMEILGRCGGKNKYLSEEEFYKVLTNYKFYFAFENSYHCLDYVTEKTWYNSFYSGLVPIIWGPTREDLEALLPPKSYIFYEDFANVTNLIKYLNYLENNQSAYMEYFTWRTKSNCYYPLFGKNDKNVRLDLFAHYNNALNGFCNLCKKLHKRSQFAKPQVISSLSEVWFGNERTECLS